MLLVVAIANAIGATMVVPQARQLLQTRNTAGVSPEWAAMGASINLWWALYGAGIRDWAIIPVSLISVMVYTSVAYALLQYSELGCRGILRRLTVGATVGLIPLAVLAVAGWPATGVALGTLYAVQLTPAVATAYRAVDVSGVSATTWSFTLVEALLWGGYAVPARDLGLTALAITGVTMSTLVLVRLWLRRSRHTASVWRATSMFAQ